MPIWSTTLTHDYPQIASYSAKLTDACVCINTAKAVAGGRRIRIHVFVLDIPYGRHFGLAR